MSHWFDWGGFGHSRKTPGGSRPFYYPLKKTRWPELDYLFGYLTSILAKPCFLLLFFSQKDGLDNQKRAGYICCAEDVLGG